MKNKVIEFIYTFKDIYNYKRTYIFKPGKESFLNFFDRCICPYLYYGGGISNLTIQKKSYLEISLKDFFNR